MPKEQAKINRIKSHDIRGFVKVIIHDMAGTADLLFLIFTDTTN